MTDVSPEIKFGDTLMLDCTSVGDFQSCHRYARYRYVDCLSPVEAKMALSFGHCVHEALFTWYDTGDQAAALLRWNAICDENNIPLDGDKRSKTNGAAILLHYFGQYNVERKREERLAGEVGFCLPVPGIERVMIAGRMDYLYTVSGNLRIRDHKTASQIGSNYTYNVNPSLAAAVYTWAAETVLERRVEMFDFDVVLVAKEKREAIRFPVMRSQWKIDSALEDLRMAARDIRSKVASGAWDRNLKHCSSYGGCQYHAICTTENPAPIIQSMFTIEPWKPYVVE